MENQKHLFHLPADIHYLNCAYKAPLLKTAEEAAIKVLVKQRNPADISHTDFFADVEKAKALFAQVVNSAPGNVAVVPSVSYGLASVLKNIAGTKGQHAITVENEFPSGYFSVKRWCDNNGCELKVIKPDPQLSLVGKNWNEKIIDSINDDTALVVLSSVLWINGLRFDMEKIGEKCKATGAKLVVDGTQSVGALPIDVKKYHIHALVCAGYKWLLGPYSLGMAYISEEFNSGVPLEESWMNRTNAQDFTRLTQYDPNYREGAGRYNMGETSNFILMPMLMEGLKQVSNYAVPNIQAYCRELIQPLRNYLENLGVQFEKPEYFSNHIFGLKLPPQVDTEKLNEILAARKIYLSQRGETLRVAVNVFNTEEDINALTGAVDEALA